ncbi:PaaX family transcriptional regulator C-terminal domain-containing protein [Roseinatronobacter bogoriensis]|uniref:PaaX family transcriptional regulator n=1 Tax=Roseinatronobacter bogoriensis subsp. barguzinensis TaxID=441209 RepID=A0A2K8KF41_9RHOB|nr:MULTISPECIES: PaaX family transcriptional regulator C-terminal domain-containing protein [Rhodobaca]ATX64750.1 PaaX family transcriptional regulator [Rhodobaca barguzinensis]TDW38201.1 PaaX family transcriptional regulator [Rhodobaca barguzinensis]TDY69628.1 PaaX family transcriptional regulator [Rhodobaca bogoriensis DSM 18756]
MKQRFTFPKIEPPLIKKARFDSPSQLLVMVAAGKVASADGFGAGNVMGAATLSELTLSQPIRAGSFIVTVFGDVIEPRGGEVWIGNLIEFCAPFGISETLIRTAVSRLVSAQQLVGLRKGRRSYYRLTEAARAEYRQAADIIYGQPDDREWRLLFFAEASSTLQIEALGLHGYVSLNDHFAFGPARGAIPETALALTASAVGAPDYLQDLGATLWNLDALGQDYEGFLTLASQIGNMRDLSPPDALHARVLLVHAFRQIILRDPRLPCAALPPDWAGQRARRVFAQLYLDLSDAADSHVAANFHSSDGALDGDSASRYARLRQSLSP